MSTLEVNSNLTPVVVADLYVLLWSQRANCFHIEPAERMLEFNRRAYAENRQMHYVPLLIGTNDLCQEVADKTRPTLRKRDDAMTISSQPA